ncbi:MAG TPA: hypothetical protein VF290_16250 [Pyrinomonadaceae bacterium]
MKRILTQTLTTLALIMTFGLTAYAGHANLIQHDGNDAITAAPQPAEGHPDRQKDGHPN